MMILSLLLFINTVLHGIIIVRFGIKGNEPPAVFGILYAGLALAVFRGMDYAVVATMVVTAVGLVGLALNFSKLQHEKTIEKIIFIVGAAILAYAAYLYI